MANSFIHYITHEQRQWWNWALEDNFDKIERYVEKIGIEKDYFIFSHIRSVKSLKIDFPIDKSFENYLK